MKIKSDVKISSKNNFSNIVNLLFIVIIFIACLWDVASLQRIRVVDDGFCYWGIAANISGYDWSELISVSAYYSYGYSLILVPLFWLNRLGISMTILYRLAIVMNACFLSGCYLMALYMIRELFKDIPDGLKYIVSLFVTLYIGNTAQMGFAWTETFLLFIFWCIVVLVYRVMKKTSYLNILGLVAALAELFAIHMRSIGVVIAACFILICFFISRRKEIDKKYIFYTIAMSAVFFCLVIILKNYVNDYIYLGTAGESVNNVQSNVGRLGGLLSIGGIIDLGLSFIGKLFYVSAATFLLSTIGLLTAVFSLVSSFIRKNKTVVGTRWQLKEWMTCFILLSFLAEKGIESLYKMLPFARSIENPLRDDTFVYGRYADFVVGPLIILGIWAVYNIKSHYNEIILAVLISIVSTVIVQFLYNVMAFRKGSDTVAFRFAAAPWLAMLMDGHKTDFAYEIMLISIGVLIVLCFIRLLMTNKWQVFGIMFLVLAAVWSVLGISGGSNYTTSKMEKEKSVDTVVKIVETTSKSVPVYMVGGANTEVKILQWLLADRSIHLIEPEEIDDIDTENAVILGNSSNVECMAKLSEKLDFLYDSGYISVFGNPESNDYESISAKAQEMAHAAGPTVNTISLADVATEYSYTKVNGSLYYNYQGTDGGYMTKEMGITPEDGTYEFTIDMRIMDCVSDTEIGYITVGDAAGNVQYIQTLNANDFIEKARQKIIVTLEVKDYAEPVIGVYTYGKASIRIYDISYRKTDGCICLDSDETEEISAFLDTMGEKLVYYVDSDNSGRTGFPWWEYGELKYLPGQMFEFKTTYEDAYYIIEKTDKNILNNINNMQKIFETDNYMIFGL